MATSSPAIETLVTPTHFKLEEPGLTQAPLNSVQSVISSPDFEVPSVGAFYLSQHVSNIQKKKKTLENKNHYSTQMIKIS